MSFFEGLKKTKTIIRMKKNQKKKGIDKKKHLTDNAI
jgi:hypothetical protein